MLPYTKNTYPIYHFKKALFPNLRFAVFVKINILLPRVSLWEDQSPSVTTKVNLYFRNHSLPSHPPLYKCLTHSKLVIFERPIHLRKNLPFITSSLTLATSRLDFGAFFEKFYKILLEPN